MLTEKEEERLVNEITKLCKINGVDEQIIDFFAETDRQLTYIENYNILKENYNLKDKNDMKNYAESINNENDYEKWHRMKEDGLSLFDSYTPFFIAVVGERESGKTVLGHRIVDKLRTAKKMPIYVLKYPKPELLRKIGYKNLKELRSVEHLNNIILWLDEPQLILKKYDKRNNDILMELLSICRHKNIILVITTNDTRWINKGLESYVDVWFCKDIDYEMVKQGARIKYIIKQHSVLDPQAFKLNQNQYLMYYRKDEDYQGEFEFGLPSYWNEEYSKVYESAIKTPNESSNNTAKKNNCEVK